MMQKHHRDQIPVDRMSAKTSKTKSTLKQKREPHKEPKQPSPPKKQCTEESSYFTQNGKKTCTDPTAVPKRNNTTGPKNSPCDDENKNEETMHATCVINQHLNSEDQASAQEYRCTSPSSKLQSVLKQASKFREEHLINSQVLTVNNVQSSTVSNGLSSTVYNDLSATVNNDLPMTVCNGQSGTVSNGSASTANNSQSATINNDLSSTICNGQSETVRDGLASIINNGPSAIVRNSQFCDSSAPSSTSAPKPVTIIIIDENSPDPPSWVTMANCYPDDPECKLDLYTQNKARILQKTMWLSDSEIHAGQMLLKRDFPFVDGLVDPAIKGSLVVPATSDFIQIINTGSHWVCLSTISTKPSPGTVKIFDSMYHNANSTSIEHACRMLMYPGEKLTIVNEKVQRQVGGSDCGLFSLAYATDLCHGIDRTNQKYNQGSMRQHYVSCLENGTMSPFPKTEKRVPFHLGSKKSPVAIYCVC
ncbi:uncharacterized protein LOC122960771 [Acropora millepora]|uniref:uncharacterized protein LOC122960771 n=1 Tax=Acropora millepora TaxID=45264 RepID=UPI001CF1240C|nr:uncharacterized protein LOC122960771 [Acropora millepora]